MFFFNDGSTEREQVLLHNETGGNKRKQGEDDTKLRSGFENQMGGTGETLSEPSNSNFPVFYAKGDTAKCIRDIEIAFRSGKDYKRDFRGGVNGIFRSKATLSDSVTIILMGNDWHHDTLVTNCNDEIPIFSMQRDYYSILGYYQTYNSLGIVFRTLPEENLYTVDLVEKLDELEDPYILVCEQSKEGVWHWHMIWFTSKRCDNAKRTLQGLLDGINISISTQQTKSFRHLLRYILKQPRVIHVHGADNLMHLCGSIMHEEHEPLTKKESFSSDLVKDIIDAMRRTNKYTFEELLNFAPETMSKFLHKPNIEAIINNCKLFLLRPTDIRVTYEKIVNNKEYVPTDFFLMHAFLMYQGIEPIEFYLDLWAILFRKPDKKNTFVIQGPSNTGKTTFLRNMLPFFNWGEIQSSGQFMFQNCINKELLIWEEPLIGSDYVEGCKRVFEGMQTQISVKYRAPQTMYRTPIIVTTNKDLWHYCSADESALKNRMFLYFFNRSATEFSYEWIGDNYSRLRRSYRECIDHIGAVITKHRQIHLSCSEPSRSTGNRTSGSDSECLDNSRSRSEVIELSAREHLGACQGILKRWNDYRRSGSSTSEDLNSAECSGFTVNDSASTDDNSSGSGHTTGDSWGRRSDAAYGHSIPRGHKRRRHSGHSTRSTRGRRSSSVTSTDTSVKKACAQFYTEQFGPRHSEKVSEVEARIPESAVDWQTNTVKGGYGRELKPINWFTFVWYGWKLYNAVG
nr:MAG: nonstructural protein [Army ant associated chapparvovirus 4]